MLTLQKYLANVQRNLCRIRARLFGPATLCHKGPISRRAEGAMFTFTAGPVLRDGAGSFLRHTDSAFGAWTGREAYPTCV
jgi:hypothetical protein